MILLPSYYPVFKFTVFLAVKLTVNTLWSVLLIIEVVINDLGKSISQPIKNVHMTRLQCGSYTRFTFGQNGSTAFS